MLKFAAYLLVVSSMFGQAVQKPNGAPTTITANTALVTVPALIRSAGGELLTSLTPRDLRLTDNGIEQHLFMEHIERQPLAVVVLMQTGGAAPRQFANYRNVGTLLDYLMGSAPHQVALVTFDSVPEDIWDFTPNARDLEDGFTHPVSGDHGAAVVNAVGYAIDLLDRQPATTHRIILLLSQPQDDGSSIRAEEVVRRLGQSNTTIYSITFSPEKTWLKDQFTKPRHGNPPYQMSPDHAPLLYTFNLSEPLGVALKSMREDTAAQLATLSGGEQLKFDSKASLERQLSLLANDIPNSYTLTFRPSANTPGLHTLHLEVLHQPGPVTITTRTGYWSSPPQVQ